METSKEKVGPIFGPRPNYGREISDGQLRSAVADALDGQRAADLAELLDVSDETIRNWQRKKRTPHFAEGLRAAAKVPKLEAAILQIMRQGSLNPQPDALLDILFDALLDIQAMGGPASVKARAAIRKFSHAKGQA